ncbi:AbrB/MazE/SpoVT family DNA-binding domain-containing protein [Alicyclobacillus dauci]|uniref:AbrB/MazE/SpoVT family DNA-binding domain-containing protein n=1 Tax=Alicyclobacillus dauci TaxID=1475485 RepID=A0ABY6Z7G3_9BACL|nr:AbrB/MazE/SpoVT family DNA-binding domain-containing protein [Alicyclobacillus dauci]WAH38824.1 AbrB/MazE/SpoVT family DNA-binding domain-containing protein [Alicyclobacillus dauci]
MKSTGVVRKVDMLGRIVMPIELRKTLNIDVRDPIEIFVNEDRITLRKYEQSCLFCDNVEDVPEFKGKPVCQNCRNELLELATNPTV